MVDMTLIHASMNKMSFRINPMWLVCDEMGIGRSDREPSDAMYGRLPYGAIVHHIGQNLSRRITVAELAGIARLSVFQLSRAFRREHETTPYRLVLEIRIRHATDILGAGATIAETALRTRIRRPESFHAAFQTADRHDAKAIRVVASGIHAGSRIRIRRLTTPLWALQTLV